MRPLRAAPILAFTVLWFACSAAPSGDDGGTGGGAGGGTGGGASDAGPTVDAGVAEKFVFVFEASPSLSVTDPNASRAVALRRTLDALPNDPRTSIAVLTFSGSVMAILSNTLFDFTPLTQLTATDRATMSTRLTNFTAPTSDGGTGGRDWVDSLSKVYAFLYRDTMRVLTFGEPQSRYTIIFVTDGSPSENQDDELLCGAAVAQLRGLAPSAVDVRFHTVHVFMPSQPVSTSCTEDAGIVAGTTCAVATVRNPVCPIIRIDLDAERLRRMASVGGGRALDFRAEPVDFSSLVP